MVGRGYLEHEELGVIEIIDNGEGISSVNYVKEKLEEKETSRIIQCKKELLEYFDGKRKKFDIKLSIDRGTEFQRSCWKAMQGVSYGETISYGEEARIIGNPKGVRAVGSANGKNPISIIIPCHRIIAKSGKLGGYTGGLDKKKFLLRLELGEEYAKIKK